MIHQINGKKFFSKHPHKGGVILLRNAKIWLENLQKKKKTRKVNLFEELKMIPKERAVKQ